MSEADSDSGSNNGHDHAPNGDSESTTSVAINQQGGANDGEDGMFVDCSDELITMDSKPSDNSNEEGAAGDNDNGEEVNQVVHQEGHFGELGSAGEVEQLRRSLELQQEEREAIAQGVIDLHLQLKALSSPKSVQYEGEDGVREVVDVPLKEMIKESLELVKTASEDWPKVSNDSLQVSTEAQLEKDHNIEIALDKMISSLGAVIDPWQLSDHSVSGKIVYIEEGTTLLIEKYNQILSEIYQLGQSFSEVGLEQEHGNILLDARGGLLHFKRKESEFVEKLAHLEDENRKLVEELEKERVMIGELNSELGNTKAELEQEKIKCANTKEKLSMAVTKGKALVQQRDTLKTSLAEKSSELAEKSSELAEKSSELEKCLTELQEKSLALEAAEFIKEELARRDSVVESLQNSLLQNSTIFEQVEEILSHVELDRHEISDVTEKVRWLVDDRNVLKDAVQELHKLKDTLSLVDLPEHVSSSDLGSQMNWLRDSFHMARDDNRVLQEEISKINQASSNHIDRLSISLLLELQEKDYLQSELTDLRFKYKELVGMNHHLSLEKDQMVKMLVELSGVNLEDEGIDKSPSSTTMIIDLCFRKLKELNGPASGTSNIDSELFERIQSFLYVRDQGLILYEDILEEEMVIRSDLSKLSNELKVASEEITALKEERSSLMKDLERSEEKSSMLRDKLSMAVKKGKGLVQDRDNLKGLINEKDSEIEQLRIDLQKQESAVSEYMDQINRLSSEVQNIPKLQADLLEMERERNQFEQLLTKSQNMLQRVMEYIDGIALSVDPVFDEPVEKVKWFAGYVSECQDAKVHAEQELQIAKEEATILETKLAEAQENIKSLERGLSSLEESVSQLAEQKKELEHEKSRVGVELEKFKENVADACSTTRSLEDALSQAEKDISVLSSEKEQAQAGRVAAETELERVKDETMQKTAELAEASRTIKDLEDKLSQVQTNVNLLTEKYNADQAVKTDMENELKKLQDEAANHARKLVDASDTIRSLEDELVKAQDNVSSLEDANKMAKEEISSLGFKLKSCMDELAGRSGSLENKSVELIGIISDLQVLMKNNILFPRVKRCFESKFETLKNMDHVLNKIRGHIVSMAAKDLEGHPMKEENLHMREELLDSLENFDVELDNREMNGADIDTVVSSFSTIVKGFQLRNKHIAEKFDELSNSIDEFTSPLHEKLLDTETKIMTVVENMQTMKEKENTIEKLLEEKDNIISSLENDIGVLLSACTDATGELQFEVDKSLQQLGSISEVENLNHETDEQAEHHKDRIYAEASQKLKNASRKARTLIRHFENQSEHVAVAIENLQIKLKETTAAFERTLDERDANTARIEGLQIELKEIKDSLERATNERDANAAKIEALENKLKETTATFEMLKDERGLKTSIIEDLQNKLNETTAAFENTAEERTVNAAKIGDLQNKLKETTAAFEMAIDERDINRNRVLQLESDVQELRSSCNELRNNLEGHHALEEKLKEKEAEILSLNSTLSAKEKVAERSLLSASQVRDLFDKVDGVEIPILESEENYGELHTSAPAKKLFHIVDSVTKLRNQIDSLYHDKEELQSSLETKDLEIKNLKEEVKQLNRNWEDSKMAKNDLSDITFALEKVLDILGAGDWVVDRKSTGLKELISALEKHIRAILLESENSRSKVQELGIKLVGSQKFIDELTTKVKLLEGSRKDKTSHPEAVQQRSLFDASSSSLVAGSEITEVEEAGLLGNNALFPVSSAANVRNMRKGSSSDHLALEIGGESDALIKSTDTDDDKGHAFRSLNTSGLVPKQGKLIADRIDGFWVSGGRILMNRPRARLGLIGYLLLLHIWLLGTIL
ncbi:golgin subfamily B member 1 isoform X1 [Arachis ipaensis]|uniref:golgin subfamily B member 1 isoform X1 n=1 Tax=Arachis ipaensis TaxID=130454 RepID=UPI0007AF25D3|nr:golgin subfamily B member 1 isoform X1 [Arachis ipaensis]XP_016180031.1 golgin subfamily B member 1 isoform X1 [Arachis ipaensis]XP_020969330.1 golgin subfamily B member 1 isoform X1 [Arachis ipaensis]XP_025683390.1 golgin subfamily B member 1 isoform X1 [Arachis hypogaea]XP_025683391.1 golgin subfamily B member 1 isoform X1 [Arachis hypogaea]XP_025683392.1 golgin subfamily B member 1 isoform X1 [Arachis hypogaea]QHN81474.1 uncharacterized protein DS421_20g687210 [Arachis hypogaea]